jgi:hypothetical protein
MWMICTVTYGMWLGRAVFQFPVTQSNTLGECDRQQNLIHRCEEFDILLRQLYYFDNGKTIVRNWQCFK